MNIPPMLCELGDPEELDRLPKDEWIIERKYDGERIIAQWDRGKVAMWTRRDLNVAKKFPEIVESMGFLKGRKHTVLDGELIVGRGHEDLMTRQTEDQLVIRVLSRRNPAKYIIFDVLFLDGESLMERPLSYRREMLGQLIGLGRSDLLPCPSFSMDGARKRYESFVKEGSEGAVAKRLSSHYLPGRRTRDWLKFKRTDIVDVEVIGARRSETGQPFGSLIMMRNGKYFGCVGSGFSSGDRASIMEFLRKHESDSVPVVIPRDVIPVILTTPIPAEVKVNAILENGSPRAPVWVRFKR